MIERIISGGQTGADRGGLDAAIELGIAHGGWCPKGRLAEDGRVPSAYQLQETPSPSYPGRTRMNVRDSDGTVIFTVGPITRGSALTLRLAMELGRQAKHINLEVGERKATKILARWLGDCAQFGTVVRTLNVAGSRESSAPGIRRQVCAVLIGALKHAAQTG